MKGKRSTVFIVELFILFIILLVVIVTITTLSMKTRDQSISAGRLTDAVICAENTAEVTSGAGNVKEAAEMIAGMDDTEKPSVKDNVITARTEKFIVRVEVDEEKGTKGKYIKKKIEVFSAENSKKIYDLDTGNYVRRDEK
jgi:hypothetical protein